MSYLNHFTGAPITDFFGPTHTPTTHTANYHTAIPSRAQPKITVDSSGNLLRNDEAKQNNIFKQEVSQLEPIVLDSQALHEKYRSINEEIQLIHETISSIKVRQDRIKNYEENYIDAIEKFITEMTLHTEGSPDILSNMHATLYNFRILYETELQSIMNKDAEQISLLEERRRILSKNKETLISFFRTVNDTLTDSEKQEINKPSNICGVCYEQEVNRVCVPCGHVFCGGCIESLDSKCATCNQSFTQTIRFYMNVAGQ